VLPSLPVGVTTITASYSGDGSYTSASEVLAQTVDQATPSVTIDSSQMPSTFGQAVTFTASVTGAGGMPTGTVQFAVDGVDLGGAVALDGSGQATLMTSALEAGTRQVSATYSGNADYAPAAGLFAQIVGQAAPVVTVVSSQEPSSFGQEVTFTATVSGPGATPTGSIQFAIDGTNEGGPVALDANGVASFSRSD